MPAAAELSEDTLYETRERLEAYCKSVAPDVETNPNTVIGDLIITPQSYILAAIEQGMDRLMSDMQLENVAEGTIYNCEFVSQWLKNFAVDTTYLLKPSGVIRIIFKENKQYALDRHTTFTSGSYIFSCHLPNTGEFIIYPVGKEVPAGVNGTTLIATGSGDFFADVPVIGETNIDAISAGTSFAMEPTFEQVGSVTAMCDFDAGTETISLQDLAKRARTTLHSASLNTRNGAINYLKSVCPFIECVYATHNGDREMLRDMHNAYGVSMGVLDLYARSKSYNFTEKQTLTLYLNDDWTAYVGEWPYVGQPYHVESVTHKDVPDQKNLEHTITSYNDVGLGAIAAYSTHEKLSISVKEAVDENGDSYFNPKIDEQGRLYTQFTITYQTDPLFPAIAKSIENKDIRPVNTDVLVRGFIPIIIEKFEVEYVRTPGVLPDLETAFRKIKEYMSNLGAPYAYSEAEIAHIMQEAGAKYTKGVNLRARVQWSVGHKISDYNGGTVDVPQAPVITNSKGLRIQYPPESQAQTADEMFACSIRTIRYWFMEGSLTFKEVRDI